MRVDGIGSMRLRRGLMVDRSALAGAALDENGPCGVVPRPLRRPPKAGRPFGSYFRPTQAAMVKACCCGAARLEHRPQSHARAGPR